MSIHYFGAVNQVITTGHWITDQVSLGLKSFGISEPQYNVLRILKGGKSKPLDIGSIQMKMIQRNSNVSRIVDKLVDKDLVERKECSDNRRKMDVSLTQKGLDLLDELNSRVQEFHEPMIHRLTKEELISLQRLIKKLKG
ncbi:MAG: MarR family transcriptional regulator [Saprospiraceae bacterium]|nr:MarR family transcriptional regulator [Saprospiraceae bacterium]